MKSKSTITTMNPANGNVIKEYQLQSLQDVQDVAEAAHEAFLSWRDVTLEDRADRVRALGSVLLKHKQRLAENITRHMGKPIAQSLVEVERCAALCDYTATSDREQLKDEPRDLPEGRAIITFQPLGVILSMQPWNFPLYQIVRCAVPNLLAGNTMVIKHAECVWGVAEELQELCAEAAIPEHVFNTIYCDDNTADALIAYPAIRGVSMTGSAKGGRIVGAEAGKHLKKSVLELGGSDPYIILEDADIEHAAQICAHARTLNTGQTCINAKRFIVVDAVYDVFKAAFLREMRSITYGDPMDESSKMGCMARHDMRDKLHQQVTDSIKKGAVCLLGGNIPQGKGAYYPATVLEHVTPNMPAYDEELFGPVASLIRAIDEEDAIRIANDHQYGLGSGIFTKDTERAIHLARKKIDAGMVNINGFNGSQPHLPFGGVKDSGYGREHGGFGVREFVNIKSVMISTIVL